MYNIACALVYTKGDKDYFIANPMKYNEGRYAFVTEWIW